MLSVRGIKARPHDIDLMVRRKPDLVEMHCSVQDLGWMPSREFGCGLAIHIPEYHAGGADGGRLLDPASLDEQKRKDAEVIYVQAVGRAIAWADFFSQDITGRPKVVFHPGGMDITKWEKSKREAAIAQLGKTITAMKKAAGDDVEILLENMPTCCWFFGGNWFENIATDCRELRSICEAHGIGATLDLCHLHLASKADGFDPISDIAHIKPLVQHVHYSDAEGDCGEGLQIGEGEMDIAAYFKPIMDLDVVAVPEIWFGHENGGYGFTEAWRRTEELLPKVVAHGK